MRSPFFEKRRQLREPVESGSVRVGDYIMPLVNWSQNGLLMHADDPPAQRGGRVSAQVELLSAGHRFTFPAELRVVRWQPESHMLAASYVCLDVPEARRIATHFQPRISRPHFIADRQADLAAKASTAEKAPPPKPDGTRKDTQSEPPGGEDTVRLADMVIAQKEVAALKVAFARLFHPDTAVRDESYPLRVEMFKQFWAVLEAADNRLKGRKPSGS